MRKGFTMIELVFVIVIIGVLSAIGLAKFKESSIQAHNAVVLAFMGNLNRNVQPSMMVEGLSLGSGRRLGCYSGLYERYTNIPKEVEMKGSVCVFSPTENGGATISLVLNPNNNTNEAGEIERLDNKWIAIYDYDGPTY